MTTSNSGGPGGPSGTPGAPQGAYAPGAGSRAAGGPSVGSRRASVAASVRVELWPPEPLLPNRTYGPIWASHAASGAVCRRERLGHDTDPLVQQIREGQTPDWYTKINDEVWLVRLPADVIRVVMYSQAMEAASVWTCRTPYDADLLAAWLAGETQ